jgi:hypothetical protein
MTETKEVEELHCLIDSLLSDYVVANNNGTTDVSPSKYIAKELIKAGYVKLAPESKVVEEKP